MVNRYNSDRHHRRSIRLKGYDYSRPGAYFVTICTHNRECLFGEIVDGKMRVSEYGRSVRDEWGNTVEIRREIELREFVIMPNHIHGIVIINAQPVGAYGNTPHGNTPHSNTPHSNTPHSHAPMRSPSKTLGAMVRGFKSSATKHINTIRKTPGAPVWQRNYFEHIIRDDADYNRISEYIAGNAQRWIEDQLHPDYKSKKPNTTGIDTETVGITGVGAYGHTPLTLVMEEMDLEDTPIGLPIMVILL